MPTYSQTRFPGFVEQTVYAQTAAPDAPAAKPLKVRADDHYAGDKQWEGDYTNSKLDDGQYASIELKKWDNSYVLRFKEFGFALPSNATVLGIQVEFEVFASLAGKIINQRLSISAGPDNKGNEDDFWPASPTVYVRGAANDIWGAAIIYPADVNATGFTVFFECENYEYNGTVWGYLDYVKATVYYTAP